MKNCFKGFSVEAGVGNIVLERRHTSYDKEHCPTACQDKQSSWKCYENETKDIIATE